MNLKSLKVWVFILTTLTVLGFAGAWIHFIQQGKNLDKSGFVTEPLRVVAYPTFISQFGPGPDIAQAFQTVTGVPVKWLNAGDSDELLQKLRLKGERFKADVVIGLDQFALNQALDDFEWLPVEVSAKGIKKGLFYGDGGMAFVPVSWSPLGILYRNDQVEPISSVQQLQAFSKEVKWSLPHPRTSSPGKHFGNWLFQNLEANQALDLLNFLIGSGALSPASWSTAYGVFQRKQVKATFSYLTSIVYQQRELKETNVSWMEFEEPLPVQVEYAGVLARCTQCELAEKFVTFLLDPAIQRVIMNKNYMLPVRDDVVFGTPFSPFFELSTLELSFELSPGFAAWLAK